MKLKTILCVALVATAATASAGVSFTSATGATNTTSAPNTNVCAVVSRDGYQFVAYNVTYSTATNSTLRWRPATTAVAVTATNVLGTTATTNAVASTNGLTPGDTIVLERAGTVYLAGLSALAQTTNGTNVILSQAWGVSAQPGDNIYALGTATSIPLAASTNQINGTAVAVGNNSAPLIFYLGPAITPSALSVTGEYK